MLVKYGDTEEKMYSNNIYKFKGLTKTVLKTDTCNSF